GACTWRRSARRPRSRPGRVPLGCAGAPRWDSRSHAPDESAKLGVEPRATDRVRSGLPPPVKLEASAVPRQNGGGPDDDEGGPPARPEAGQPDPEKTIPTGKPGAGDGGAEGPRVGGGARGFRARRRQRR